MRITALVLLAVKRFKQPMVAARALSNEVVSDGSTLESMKDQPAKFSMFHVGCIGQVSPSLLVSPVSVNVSHKTKGILLDDRALSRALEYIYKKTT